MVSMNSFMSVTLLCFRGEGWSQLEFTPEYYDRLKRIGNSKEHDAANPVSLKWARGTKRGDLTAAGTFLAISSTARTLLMEYCPFLESTPIPATCEGNADFGYQIFRVPEAGVSIDVNAGAFLLPRWSRLTEGEKQSAFGLRLKTENWNGLSFFTTAGSPLSIIVTRTIGLKMKNWNFAGVKVEELDDFDRDVWEKKLRL